MKELNVVEMQNVSGSGILSITGGIIGTGIGSIIDIFTPGDGSILTDAAHTIGRFIGASFENPAGPIGVMLANLLGYFTGALKPE